MFLETLRQSGGISAITRQLGTTPAVAANAVETLLPDLLDDFLQYRAGLSGLLDLIDEAGGGDMAQAIMLGEAVDVRPGEMILSQIKRQGAVSRADPAAIARIEPELRARIMPLLAMLMGGYLSARSRSGGLDLREIAAMLEARKQFYSAGEDQV